MRKFIYILIFLTLIGVSCVNRNTCSLSGTITNGQDSTILYLMDLDSLNFVDTIVVQNGTFNIRLNLSLPTKFVLHNKRNRYEFKDRKFIWLEPSEISIKGNFDFLKNLQVNGSVSNTIFEKYNQLIDSTNKRINILQEQIHFKSESEKVVDQNKINSLKNDQNNEIVSFMIDHKNSYVSLSELHSECYMTFRHLDKKQIKLVYNNFSNELKITVKGIEIKNYLELPEPPKIGDIAPEIIQITPSGDTIRLSDFKGKYVLLEFWSSSCGPCRANHKWLRRTYKRFNPRGLEILEVSGDKNKGEWMEAIRQDSIPWVNISDLKGWKNEAFLLYDIKFIPYNILINPDGIIVKELQTCEPYFNKELENIFDNKNGL